MHCGGDVDDEMSTVIEAEVLENMHKEMIGGSIQGDVEDFGSESINHCLTFFGLCTEKDFT